MSLPSHRHPRSSSGAMSNSGGDPGSDSPHGRAGGGEGGADSLGKGKRLFNDPSGPGTSLASNDTADDAEVGAASDNHGTAMAETMFTQGARFNEGGVKVTEEGLARARREFEAMDVDPGTAPVSSAAPRAPPPTPPAAAATALLGAAAAPVMPPAPSALSAPAPVPSPPPAPSTGTEVIVSDGSGGSEYGENNLSEFYIGPHPDSLHPWQRRSSTGYFWMYDYTTCEYILRQSLSACGSSEAELLNTNDPEFIMDRDLPTCGHVPSEPLWRKYVLERYFCCVRPHRCSRDEQKEMFEKLCTLPSKCRQCRDFMSDLEDAGLVTK
uniref:Uncharacterized protein n=1 Tax=Florenciella parvula TaxID=236787 RepID=A0A7S2G9H8_9STRA|mmetsp:Transcript_5613/g.11434  ORF Transcript_5613/g.11434 Transcript_5613/m.11434 type:complete len:325 (+) Transcript_5613:226-1200(+)